MTDPDVVHAFLVAEVEALAPFDFVAVMPPGRSDRLLETTRLEDSRLQVRVPGRPPVMAELPAAVRTALRDRGFTSEDPDDPDKPWTREAASAQEAVTLLRELLTGVFDEKADGRLDVGHGSHRAEHEALKKLAVARTRIEDIVTELLGSRPEQDSDGDYVLPIQEVHVMVSPRAAPNGQIVVRVFAIANVGVEVTPELGLFLARLNFGLMFGRFALDTENRSIWFDETLLGEQFREEELRFAIGVVASTADEWDDRLKQMFGGVTYQEVLAGRSAESPPPTKPGAGTGQYL